MISINVLFISLHHPDSGQNDQDTDNVLYGKIFVKNDHCPYLRPQKVNTFVGIGCGQGKFLDDLLPRNGIDPAVQYHEKKKNIKHDTVKAMAVILY